MSKFFIERPILANVIAIITILLGAVCLLRLPVAEYPEIVPPTIQVSTSYPGASADIVATTVGIPIEQGVNGVESSIYMQSTSGSDGSYALTVTFAVGTDLNAAIALVQNAVNGALSQLPQDVQTQGVKVQKVSTNILLIGSLYSDDDRFDETFLSNYAIINLQNPIARLPGVGQVQVLGAGPYGMRIWLDPIKLRAYGLTVPEVQNAIQNQNIQVASGQLGGPPVPSDQVFQFTVKAMGRLSERLGVRRYHRQGPTTRYRGQSDAQDHRDQSNVRHRAHQGHRQGRAEPGSIYHFFWLERKEGHANKCLHSARCQRS